MHTDHLQRIGCGAPCENVRSFTVHKALISPTAVKLSCAVGEHQSKLT